MNVTLLEASNILNKMAEMDGIVITNINSQIPPNEIKQWNDCLKKAKESGDFVYVGVYDDITVNKRKGKYNPVLNINERCLNLLALKYVDDVIFGAPEMITQDLIHNLNVDIVIQFITPKIKEGKCYREDKIYEAAKKVGKLKEVEISGELTNDVLSERIWENKEQYIKKYIKKSAKVDDHIKINGQEVQHI